MLDYRVLRPDELEKIRNIDRTEQIRRGYEYAGGVLREKDVVWDSVRWCDGDGIYSYGQIIRGVDECLTSGGTAFAAFDGDRLVGIATHRPEIRPDVDQLDLLHVTDGYRRRGIASRLFEDVLRQARRGGANRLYVSATPSESAVRFYMSRGFRPTDEPVPELFAEEPDDIHMTLDL